MSTDSAVAKVKVRVRLRPHEGLPAGEFQVIDVLEPCDGILTGVSFTLVCRRPVLARAGHGRPRLPRVRADRGDHDPFFELLRWLAEYHYGQAP